MTKVQKREHKTGGRVVRAVFVLAFFGLVFSKLALSGKLSTRGGDTADLLERKARIEEQNQILENQLATVSALDHICHRAQEELGMEPSSAFELLAPPRLAGLPQ